ncbi:histidine phosphatase family protein [Luteimicrobium subarcticum]|uniref:histidine phosphatase family protein n=1 Tax=Luteimicrobium subarcticum TaxID=620910 RepID=UPI000C25043F|nr:histidine phosphatase family protein [Luteimicrobium subarcticum]
MSARTLVLVRHGRTAWNAAGRLQGQTDVPLDDVGRWQAERGARSLFLRHQASLVVSSDLSRAADTARAYAEAADASLVLDPRLRERGFGSWEGLTRDEIDAGWPEQAAAWHRGEEPRGIGVESKSAVAARMVDAILEHAATLDPRRTLTVVSHGAAITVALAQLLGQDAGTWRGIAGLHNVHWSQVVRSSPGTDPEWRLATHDAGPDIALDEWNSGPQDQGDDADWISGQESA